MNSVFVGFSEADLQRIKSEDVAGDNGAKINMKTRRIESLGFKSKNNNQVKSLLSKSNSDKLPNSIEKCMLSTKSSNSIDNEVLNNNIQPEFKNNINERTGDYEIEDQINVTPDVIKFVENYMENEVASHKEKLEELQIRQKMMEEQNKKRKEMLAKALADRTKQTEEEVLKLEKIKKELQVLDGQFTHDVAMLRKKIDSACLNYSEAEKHYLRVEKEFLQAKINLQKEKEKKELLTEHLCALITHNETRKAQKLETLMLELAHDRSKANVAVSDESPVIIDGVDERTGKMVEMSPMS